MYYRLVLIGYLLSLGLIYCTPTYLWIKLFLAAALVCYFLLDFKSKSPCRELSGLRVSQSKWTLLRNDGQLKHYEQTQILIHNELFQLIKLTNSGKHRKLLVIFNDQVTLEELRLMHLKIATSPNLC